ncbi:MAG: glycosyltransferase family 9 protein [Ectothiorhodospiraceae bacterium]|nr:glycosyltransferase family 9 protein [Chromatiales bacterium]MCP5156557.1 glycosyltransferase family 9 protein [Ectothiorhodospiraceae bacterium]
MSRWSQSLAGDATIRRILVVKWSAMGDVVIATAAIEDLARCFPAAELTLSTLPPWARLFEADPRIARTLALDTRGPRAMTARLEWVRAVRSGGFDLAVDLQSSDHTAGLLAVAQACGARIRHRVGFHRRLPYDIAPAPPPPPVHAHAYARAALAAAGVPGVATRPVLHVPAARREAVAAMRREVGLADGEYAVLFPGSQAAGHLKRWGTDRYAALARRLVAAGRVARVALIGGPDEREACAAIAESAGNAVVDLCGRTQLLDVVALAESARFAVGNDTGTAHLASAAGRPMVVVCGPTDPRRVRPLGETVRTVQADLPCINCYRKTCAHHACMRLVTPDDVLEALDLG